MRVGPGPDDLGAVPGADLVGACDVVAVMMREQDHVEPPAGGIDRRDDGRDLGGVDDRGGAGRARRAAAKRSCRKGSGRVVL